MMGKFFVFIKILFIDCLMYLLLFVFKFVKGVYLTYVFYVFFYV